MIFNLFVKVVIIKSKGVMGIADKISSYNRKRKYEYFVQNIPYNPTTKILDVGFTNKEYSPVDNFLEKNYQHTENITALGVNGKDLFEKRYPEVNVVLYDGNIFPFADKSFDIGWSNAVIEHVGQRDKQLLFLKELLRTCRVVYFTTPNLYFPVEVHTRTLFMHWLPKSIFDRFLKLIGKSWATGDYMYLLSKKDIIDLCKKAGAKKIEIKGNRLVGFAMDFSVVIE